MKPKTKCSDGEVVAAGYRLYERWVSSDKKVDLLRVRAAIRQEIAWTRAHPARMSAGCLTECRADLKRVGSILKHHPDLFNHELVERR
jgi:hypothetical protein